MAATLQPQQQFTFIDTSAPADTNKRRVKSHVAFDTNKRKRRSAVAEHLSSLEQRPRSSSSSSLAASSPLAPVEGLKSQSSPDSSRQLSRTIFLATTDISPSPPHWPAVSIRPDENALTPQQIDDSAVFKQGTKDEYVDSLSAFPPQHRGFHDQCKTQAKLAPAQLRFAVANQAKVRPFSTLNALSLHLGTPKDLYHVEFALHNVHSFLTGRYSSTWSKRIQEVPSYYDTDYQVSSWRESFFIASYLLSLGKSQEGFQILRGALDVSPRLFRGEHPQLLFTLMEMSLDAKSFKDPRLQYEVRSHIAQMATLTLGQRHPISILLHHTLSQDERKQAITEVMFSQIVDILSSLFGSSHYLSLSTEMAVAQFYASRGSLDRAHNILDAVADRWKTIYPLDSTPMQLMFVERAKVRAMQTCDQRMELQYVLDNAAKSYQETANRLAAMSVSGSDETSSASEAAMDSDEMKRLGKWLMSRSCHAMTIQLYMHRKEIFIGSGPSGQSWGQELNDDTFGKNVVRILRSALRL